MAGMHMWSYLATRIGGQAAFNAAYARTGSFTDPAFVQAGDKLNELIALQPFQDGYLGATHDQMQATFGNGKAAMSYPDNGLRALNLPTPLTKKRC